uniref:Secreted protein n=1 Tax=Heterorhabditis bacteriophora TaxID=37862 RepID=A0A1I7WMN8_HETBA
MFFMACIFMYLCLQVISNVTGSPQYAEQDSCYLTQWYPGQSVRANVASDDSEIIINGGSKKAAEVHEGDHGHDEV